LLGSEMLSVDTDMVLSEQDFDNAIRKIVSDVRRNKLAALLRKAGAGKYQRILEAMAKHPTLVVPLDYIASYMKEEQSQFSTNMATLIEREVIAKPNIGKYRFVDPMLKEYIRVFGVMNDSGL
jgi:hypothetical protein